MPKKIYTYSMASVGSKELAEGLGISRIKHERSRVSGSPELTIINWGASEIPPQLIAGGTRILNHPSHVARMTNKELAFNLFADNDVRIPKHTSSADEARRWVGQGKTVFARTVLSGHSGNGIVIMGPDHPENIEVRARLYTEYVKKKDEYRIHICNGRVIDQQRKGLREEFRGHADVNYMIRNLANGFVFVRNEIRVPQDVLDQALLAMRVSQLDFGAVDVIWNEQQQRAYVLEINTAPGLQGSTIQSYVNALREF